MEAKQAGNDSLDNPSTSETTENQPAKAVNSIDEHLQDLDNEQLNQALESYAKTHNLTAQKVKNIIFHIVKNPQTFATLIRKDPDAMAGLRMTRSRLHQLERIAQRTIPAPELKPINVPKTFLDVNYGEEDEDADYSPGNDTTIDIEKDEEGVSSTDDDEEMEESRQGTSAEVLKKPTLEINNQKEQGAGEGKNIGPNPNERSGIIGNEDELMEMRTTDAGASNSDEQQFLTKVDNPIYHSFIRSVMCKESEQDTDEQLYNEEDDPEYIFQEFDEFCQEEEEDDNYEFRKDRATEIPRWELKALEQDFVDVINAELPEPFAQIPILTSLNVPIESRPQSKLAIHRHVKQTEPMPTNVDDEEERNNNNIISTTSTRPSSSNESTVGSVFLIDGSCSLLAPQLIFTKDELEALKVQLEKHVQLLCQSIVGTTQYPELVHQRNSAVKMLTDLDEESKRRIHQRNSIFHISNLPAAIFSAHDIQACQEVDLPLGNHLENQPSKETMWVLGRSEACRYPELLPRHRFSLQQAHTHFIPSEQLLLALALFQLRHVPHSSGTKKEALRGKYPLIAEHFLPGKTLVQIRNHMKNVRASPSPSIIQKIICQAERGIFHAKYKPDLGETARQEIPINWPNDLQPFWLKCFAELFKQNQMEITTVPMESATDPHENDKSVNEDTVSISNQSIIEIDKSNDSEEPSASGILGKRRRTLEAKSSNEVDKSRERKRPNTDEIMVDSSSIEDDQANNPSSRDLRMCLRRRNSSTISNEIQIATIGQQDMRSPIDHFPLASTSSNVRMPANGNGNANNNSDLTLTNKGEGAVPSISREPQLVNPQEQQQKKSKRKLRTERGMAALCNHQFRDNVTNALVEAIYTDFKKRMFMHQDKLRATQSILHQPELTTAEKFELLRDRLGQSHPQLFYLFASIAPDEELPAALRTHPDRMASKQALRMMHTIQTYMIGSRSAAHAKNTFKFIKETPPNMLDTEDNLFELLQRQFGVKDEPLWRLLKREWMGARCTEKVDDSQYECLHLDQLQTDQMAMEEACKFESIKVPYRHDIADRGRLRVRHGRVTVECNGRLRNVSISYPNSDDLEQQKGESNSNEASKEFIEKGHLFTPQMATNSSTSGHRMEQTPANITQTPTSSKWTRALDTALLVGYSNSGCNRQKCISNFLSSPVGKSIDRVEAETRLQSLMNVAKQLQGDAHSTPVTTTRRKNDNGS